MAHAMAYQSYGSGLKAIHWTTVAVVLLLLLTGWTMTGWDTLPRHVLGDLYATHKSFGLLILLITLMRLSWRLTHVVPGSPPTLRPWEIFVAGLVHKIFYVLLIVQPLVGWTIHSISSHQSLFFGLFPIPKIPFLPGWAGSAVARDFLEGIHSTVAGCLAALIVLHVGAALKHHFMAKDDVLLRMAPTALIPWLLRLRERRRGRSL